MPVNKNESPLTTLGSEFHNSIELLQNRFRIDYEVEEITMVFFRKYGSSPIVLVRPDGSKIFQSTADGESIFWFDSTTYDMVSIKNPMLGPWQAVGNISPDSRVMVISELALHADKLPDVIFSGEILKQTAYLTNNGKPINYAAFRDVVELTISLASTNNPDYNNFGAGSQIVATFQDNGKGTDEIPLDGVFTGQFNLSIADGEWKPTFKVSTPMYSREQVDPNIMLYPNPIKIDVAIDHGKAGYHYLEIDADREFIDISSLLIDGKVRFPNGDIQNFSITEMTDEVKKHDIVNFGYGTYSVKLTVFGNTHSGREFILDVPEYTFLVEEPVPDVVEIALDNTSSEGNAASTLDGKSTTEHTPPHESNMSTSALISWIVGLNLLLIIIGGVVIWLITSNQKLSLPFFNQTKAAKDINDKVEKQHGMLAKLFRRKVKEPAPVEKDKKSKASTADTTDTGFMDLSMPKE
ncbi:TIGR03503 family protein [Paraglaciecola aquimarina]